MAKIRPIDSFLQYFAENKPYHTKILEVVEKYSFKENMNVYFLERLFSSVDFISAALCKPVGYGVNFDGSGYSTSSDCDLFNCTGGYGLTFDNSDLLVDEPITAITPDYVEVAGDHTSDTKFNIKTIVSANVIQINGDITSYIENHNLFTIRQKTVFTVVSNDQTSFSITDDVRSKFNNVKTINIYSASANNGHYRIKSISYDSTANKTVIGILPTKILTPSTFGIMEIDSPAKNAGVYHIIGATYSSGVSEITVNNDNTFEYTGPLTDQLGIIQLRTGLIHPRVVTLENNTEANNGDLKVLRSEYIEPSHVTRIYPSKPLEPNALSGNIKLYGYNNYGFENDSECNVPKDQHIYVNMHEKLVITIN